MIRTACGSTLRLPWRECAVIPHRLVLEIRYEAAQASLAGVAAKIPHRLMLEIRCEAEPVLPGAR